MQSIVAIAIRVFWWHSAVITHGFRVQFVAFHVGARFEVTHGFAQQVFERRQGPRHVGSADEIEVIIVP